MCEGVMKTAIVVRLLASDTRRVVSMNSTDVGKQTTVQDKFVMLEAQACVRVFIFVCSHDMTPKAREVKLEQGG